MAEGTRGLTKTMVEQAVRESKAGKRMTLTYQMGRVVLEPFTANIESVSLVGIYGCHRIWEQLDKEV